MLVGPVNGHLGTSPHVACWAQPDGQTTHHTHTRSSNDDVCAPRRHTVIRVAHSHHPKRAENVCALPVHVPWGPLDRPLECPCGPPSMVQGKAKTHPHGTSRWSTCHADTRGGPIGVSQRHGNDGAAKEMTWHPPGRALGHSITCVELHCKGCWLEKCPAQTNQAAPHHQSDKLVLQNNTTATSFAAGSADTCAKAPIQCSCTHTITLCSCIHSQSAQQVNAAPCCGRAVPRNPPTEQQQTPQQAHTHRAPPASAGAMRTITTQGIRPIGDAWTSEAHPIKRRRH